MTACRDCALPAAVRGLCRGHYTRLARHGTTSPGIPLRRLGRAVRERAPAAERVATGTATDLGWRDRAACLGLDVELFHDPDPEREAEALAVCAGCPVTDPCLEAALAVPAGSDVGVLGHTTVTQRRRLRGVQRQAQEAS